MLAKEDWHIIIPLIGGTIGFMVYWFYEQSIKIRKHFINRYGHDRGWARFIISSKYLGGITLGIIPFLTYRMVFQDASPARLGLGWNGSTSVQSLLWIIGIAVVLIPLLIKAAKRPKNLENYPRIRAQIWDRKMMVGNLVSWAFYLLCYEFYFRGLLLFPLIDQLGVWPAIAINIALYSTTHIPKGISEAIGAIPLSVVLCLLTIQTETIWIAFFVHLAMAWTNTLVAQKAHPDMRFDKKWSLLKSRQYETKL